VFCNISKSTTMSLRVKRSNLITHSAKGEIATPFGLAMTSIEILRLDDTIFRTLSIVVEPLLGVG
jgi:hypothetical protein